MGSPPANNSRRRPLSSDETGSEPTPATHTSSPRRPPSNPPPNVLAAQMTSGRKTRNPTVVGEVAEVVEANNGTAQGIRGSTRPFSTSVPSLFREISGTKVTQSSDGQQTSAQPPQPIVIQGDRLTPPTGSPEISVEHAPPMPEARRPSATGIMARIPNQALLVKPGSATSSRRASAEAKPKVQSPLKLNPIQDLPEDASSSSDIAEDDHKRRSPQIAPVQLRQQVQNRRPASATPNFNVAPISSVDRELDSLVSEIASVPIVPVSVPQRAPIHQANRPVSSQQLRSVGSNQRVSVEGSMKHLAYKLSQPNSAESHFVSPVASNEQSRTHNAAQESSSGAANLPTSADAAGLVIVTNRDPGTSQHFSRQASLTSADAFINQIMPPSDSFNQQQQQQPSFAGPTSVTLSKRAPPVQPTLESTVQSPTRVMDGTATPFAGIRSPVGPLTGAHTTAGSKADLYRASMGLSPHQSSKKLPKNDEATIIDDAIEIRPEPAKEIAPPAASPPVGDATIIGTGFEVVPPKPLYDVVKPTMFTAADVKILHPVGRNTQKPNYAPGQFVQAPSGRNNAMPATASRPMSPYGSQQINTESNSPRMVSPRNMDISFGSPYQSQMQLYSLTPGSSTPLHHQIYQQSASSTQPRTSARPFPVPVNNNYASKPQQMPQAFSPSNPWGQDQDPRSPAALESSAGYAIQAPLPVPEGALQQRMPAQQALDQSQQMAQLQQSAVVPQSASLSRPAKSQAPYQPPVPLQEQAQQEQNSAIQFVQPVSTGPASSAATMPRGQVAAQSNQPPVTRPSMTMPRLPTQQSLPQAPQPESRPQTSGSVQSETSQKRQHSRTPSHTSEDQASMRSPQPPGSSPISPSDAQIRVINRYMSRLQSQELGGSARSPERTGSKKLPPEVYKPFSAASTPETRSPVMSSTVVKGSVKSLSAGLEVQSPPSGVPDTSPEGRLRSPSGGSKPVQLMDDLSRLEQELAEMASESEEALQGQE